MPALRPPNKAGKQAGSHREESEEIVRSKAATKNPDTRRGHRLTPSLFQQHFRVEERSVK